MMLNMQCNAMWFKCLVVKAAVPGFCLYWTLTLGDLGLITIVFLL